MVDSHDFGPLPRADRNSELEQSSENALGSILPVEMFRLRCESGSDRGTDRHLEVKIDGHDTNCRSQIQLKAAEEWEANQDGSVSLSISTSNLNYLLYSPNSLYIYWNNSTSEFRYAWAQEELVRIEKVAPQWRDQGTVTLRFIDTLDDASLLEIHRRILRQSKFDREIRELLARKTEFENVSLKIDPKTLKIEDSDTILQVLLSSGMTIVASGFARECLDLVEKLTPESRRLPKIHLIRGYAEFQTDRHYLANGHLNEAALQEQNLNREERDFLDTLKELCSYRTGRISRDEYLRKQRERVQASEGNSRLSHELETLRFAHLREGDPEKRRKAELELRKLSQRILDDGDAPSPLKLNARIVSLYASGQDCVMDLTQINGLARIRQGMGVAGMSSASDLTRQYDELITRWTKWQSGMNSAVEEAMNIKHPMLLADAYFTRAAVLASFPVSSVAMNENLSQWDEIILLGMSDSESAAEIYREADCLEAELRSRLLLGDLFELKGQTEAARQLAEGILPKAEAMEYEFIKEHARELVSGNTKLSRLREKLSRADTKDEDFDLASLDNVNIWRMAEDFAEAMSLPRERIPQIANYWMSRRHLAKERIDYCQHLELWMNKSHEERAETFFRDDPPQIGVCKKLKFQSNSESSDWSAQLQIFKQTYCAECQERSPKCDGQKG